LAADEQIAKTILELPAVSPRQVERIYQGCTALLQPLPVSAWGEPVRLALACGKPVVAVETHRADALVGPAAYLIAEDDSRAMGAALITTVVETSLAERLSQAAVRQAAGWETGQFSSRLLEIYQDLLLAS
jgi:glycosyltransferase involved in cell wall biosynthesis